MTRNSSLNTLYGKRQDRYLELIHQFALRPIDNDQELDAAITVVDQLLDQAKLSQPEQDYLDVLSDLIETYEEKSIPESKLNDSDMLHALLELKEVSQTELAHQTGIAESTISEVLKGTRKLNRCHIGKVAGFFAVDPGVFDFEETNGS